MLAFDLKYKLISPLTKFLQKYFFIFFIYVFSNYLNKFLFFIDKFLDVTILF